MIRTQTIFVVGAGASCEFGLPLGTDLKLRIANILGPIGSHGEIESGLIANALDKLGRLQMNSYTQLHDSYTQLRLVQKGHVMSEGLAHASSIDDYIDSFPNDPDVARIGKLAIAACLVEAERKSDLRPHDRRERPDLSKLQDTWLGSLFRTMASEVPSTNVAKIFENVSFIVFNYDRCLEWYLEHALMRRFAVGPDAARAIISGCRIIHPYGDLGPLEKVEFGPALAPQAHGSGDQLLEISSRLLTFYESKSVKTDDIHLLLKQARRIVFLGFGFHRQNVELLTSPSARIVDFRATGHDLTKNARREVLQRIFAITGRRPARIGQDQLDEDSLISCKCGKLMADEPLFLTS